MLEPSQTSAGEFISSKYKGLVIEEASGENAPDLLDYEDRYPVWSFLNSDNIRKNSGYTQIWDTYSELEKRNCREVKEKISRGKKIEANARENKFQYKNQVELWGDHLCIVNQACSEHLMWACAQQCCRYRDKKRQNKQPCFFRGQKNLFSQKTLDIKKTLTSKQTVLQGIGYVSCGCLQKNTTISYNLSWFFPSIWRRHFQAIKLSCKHQKNNSW